MKSEIHPNYHTIKVVMTDGTEFTNRYARDVTSVLTTAHVPLYAVAVGQFYYSDEHDTRERALLLDQAPAESGGERVSLVAASGIEPALLTIGRELENQYAVVYSRPESLIPPK